MFFTHKIGDKTPFLRKNTYKYIPQPKAIQNSSKTSIKTQQRKNKKSKQISRQQTHTAR